MKAKLYALLFFTLIFYANYSIGQEINGKTEQNSLTLKNKQPLKEFTPALPNDDPLLLGNSGVEEESDDENILHTKAAPVNDNCANAIVLTSNAAPVCGQTVDQATVQVGEVVTAATVGASSNFALTVWYRFTASSATMFLEIELESVPAGTWCPTRFSTVVYNSSTCIPTSGTIIATQSNFTDGAIVINLTGLTSGNTYLVQVGYNDATGCKSPNFCVRVGDSPNPCSCSVPCTDGCGYSLPPTVAEVTATCPEYQLNPISDGGTTNNYCYTFTAINSTVSFSMIITSNCSGGNVTALTWTIQTAACGANVDNGTISNLSSTILTPGTDYVLCYNYSIPTTCHHSSLYPYFVGAAPLPIELSKFGGNVLNKVVMVEWETLSETNNDYFTLEKSADGKKYEPISIIKGAGFSNRLNRYTEFDKFPNKGINYYRLKQTDFDGKYSYSDVISVDYKLNDFKVVPNPSTSDNGFTLQNVSDNGSLNIIITDITGKIVLNKEFSTETGDIDIKQNLSPGIYLIKVIDQENVLSQKLVIE